MGWKDLKEEVRDSGVRPLEGNCVWQHGEHSDKDNNGSKDAPWKGETSNKVKWHKGSLPYTHLQALGAQTQKNLTSSGTKNIIWGQSTKIPQLQPLYIKLLSYFYGIAHCA